MIRFLFILFLFVSYHLNAEIPLNEFYLKYADSQKNVHSTRVIPAMEYALINNFDHLVPYLIKKSGFITYNNVYSFNNDAKIISVFESIILHEKPDLFKIVLTDYILDNNIDSVDDYSLTATHLTLLQYAAQKSENPIEFCSFLLDMGANPNFTLGGSSGALTFAIARRNVELAILLLEHGADPNDPSQLVSNPLDKAVEINYYEGVAVLLSYGARVTEAMKLRAAYDNNIDILNLLLEADE